MNASNEKVLECPVCNSIETAFVFQVKDHSVSKEFFDIFECSNCRLRFTTNAPDAEFIGPYYQSPDYISHSNTRKGLVNNLYHLVRTHTLASKHHLLKHETGLSSGSHLDIGAGTGAFVQYMQKAGWQSQGIEPDEKARECALNEHSTKLLPAAALDSLPAESFDAITLWHVLEHVHDLYPYLAQIKKLLKSKGKLFIAVPNYTSYDAEKYGVYWAAYDIPLHLYHFSPSSMKYLLQNAGFNLNGTKPMWFDSFYISLLSEKYKTGKASLIKGFISGGISNIHAIADKEKCSSLIYVASLYK
jgi:SAM-dependent methyltransferase